MKKEMAIVVAAILLLSALAVLPVISSDENATNVGKTKDAIIAESIFENIAGIIISGATTANETNVTEPELPIDVAATGDLVGKIAFSSDRDGDFEIYVMDANGTNVRQLTRNTATDSDPVWSPDCKKIAFASSRDGDAEIYVMNAYGTNVKQLTNNSAMDRFPDWSPDGSKIAFVSNRYGDDEIYVMNADGTNVKQLTSKSAPNWFPDWSPDGSTIAFNSDRDGDDEIYVMNADGTNVVQLTNNSAVDELPAWSPDGSTIAFNSDRDGDFEIYVMKADGTNVKQLTSNTASDGIPAWSPDGSKIAFTSERDSDGDGDPEIPEIYVMDADGTNVVKLTSNTAIDWLPDWCFSVLLEPELATITVSPSAKTLDVWDTQQFTAIAKDQTGNPMAGINITWTSTNTTVGTVSPASGTTGSDGTATTTFTALAYGTTTVTASSGTVIGTASVTVGKKGDLVDKIAFESDRDGDYEIYVMDADGTNVNQLTSNTAKDGTPAWSPDGSKIAFYSDRDGDYEIYVMDADGTNVVQLTKNSIVDLGPSWSPDGKKIAFRSGSSDMNTGIYVMNADGSNSKCLADPFTLISNQAWSPDGSKIVFEEEIGDGDEIYVMNSADGSKKQRLISPAYSQGSKMSDCCPAWSPTGDKIVFYSLRHGYHETTPGISTACGEIYIMDPDGSNLVRLTYDPYHTDFVPSWSPDGTKIAFASERDGDWEIYVMDADGTNVKKLTNNTNDDWYPSWCCMSEDGKATVSIESVSAPKGSTVTVPIRITNVTDLGAADIWLSYNKDVVIVDNVSQGGLSPVTPAINNTAGVTKMSWFSATGKTGDFVFAYVKLKAVGSAGQSSSLDLDVKELGDANANPIPRTVADGTFTLKLLSIFDTGEPANPYPSISGTHNGTLTPNQTITVSSLYTYPCAGTGGHTEYARIWNDTWIGEEASWNGYQDNWHSIIFDEPFTLFTDKEYYYEIRTGSYPQIHHTNSLPTANGWINCTSFVDANGKKYDNWIPAIKPV